MQQSSRVVGYRKKICSLVPVYEVTGENEINHGEHIYFAALAKVIQQEDLKKLAVCLESESDMIEYADGYLGTTFVHVATKYNNSALWEMLPKYKAFRDYFGNEDQRGTTALLSACWYENSAAVETLVGHCADPTKWLKDNKKTILHICANHDSSEICNIVLKDPRCREILDCQDLEGNTALAIAIRQKSPTIDSLVAAGASLLIVNPITGRNNFHTAVVFENYDFLNFLLAHVHSNYPEDQAISFLHHLDVNKDSPLTLALTIADGYSANMILKFHCSSEDLKNVKMALHSLVIGNKKSTLSKISSYAPDPSFYDVYDSEGRTPLLLAVENKRMRIIDMFHNMSVDFNTLNLYTGDSVLHVAAYTHDDQIIKMVMKYVNYAYLSSIENNLGLTAYEIILGNASFHVWKTWKQLANVEKTFENSSEESALFISAKEGNCMLVLAHLLSDKFYNYYDMNSTIDETSFLHLEVMRMVYASDVFLALGLLPEQRGWETSPKQDHLFKRNAKGMNIFHACALGGNIDCLRILNNYCRIFKSNHWQLDESDDNGNTPLFYAFIYQYPEIGRYLLLNGCNLCHANILGWAPMHSISANEKYIDILDEVISKSVNYSKQQDIAGQHFDLSFKLFQAQKDCQMQVISSLFDTLTSDQHIKILTNPVIEYFILYKWARIKSTATFKLFIHVMMVCSLSLFQTFKFCDIIQAHRTVVPIFQLLTTFFACLLLLINIPMFFISQSHYLVYLVTPLTVLMYMRTKETSRESVELGAVAVLMSWLTMITESYATKLSYQIAILLKTLQAVIRLTPLIVLSLTGFSLCFFTLFHEYYEYNNPLHAFLTLAAHMREGNMQVPAVPMPEEMDPMDTSHEAIFAPQYSNTKLLNTKMDLRSVLIEGFLLLFFRLMVIICAYNLLVDAAIKGVTEVESMGKLQHLKIYVWKLVYWENLLNSNTYRVLSSLRIAWIIGLPNSLREHLRIPTVINTLYNPVPDFETISLKWIVQETETETKLRKFFKDLTEEEEIERSSSAKRSIRRGSKVSFVMSRLRGY